MTGIPSQTGVAFTGPSEGDMRADLEARRAVALRLGVGERWATVDQVHGGDVVVVDRPGSAGPADAVVTTVPGLPLAVFTADCLGVVLTGPDVVGVAHAGWRGVAAGVLESTLDVMAEHGRGPVLAHIGPAIGPCCFEVGDDVASLFAGDERMTSWGTTSVDLVSAARRRLGGIDVDSDGRCTACGGGPSHRRDGTSERLAAIGWLR